MESLKEKFNYALISNTRVENQLEELTRIAIQSQIELVATISEKLSIHVFESNGFPEPSKILRIIRDCKKSLESQLNKE